MRTGWWKLFPLSRCDGIDKYGKAFQVLSFQILWVMPQHDAPGCRCRVLICSHTFSTHPDKLIRETFQSAFFQPCPLPPASGRLHDPVAQDQAGPVLSLGAGASKASGDHCGVQLLSSQTGNFAKTTWWHFFGSCKLAPPWKPKDFSSWKCPGMDPPKELPNRYYTHSQRRYLIWTPLISRGSNIGRPFWEGIVGFGRSPQFLGPSNISQGFEEPGFHYWKCEKVISWMAAESCQHSQSQ